MGTKPIESQGQINHGGNKQPTGSNKRSNEKGECGEIIPASDHDCRLDGTVGRVYPSRNVNRTLAGGDGLGMAKTGETTTTSMDHLSQVPTGGVLQPNTTTSASGKQYGFGHPSWDLVSSQEEYMVALLQNRIGHLQAIRGDKPI